jgi:hypothetical protein
MFHVTFRANSNKYKYVTGPEAKTHKIGAYSKFSKEILEKLDKLNSFCTVKTTIIDM